MPKNLPFYAITRKSNTHVRFEQCGGRNINKGEKCLVSWCQLAAETNQTLLVWKHSNFIDIFIQSDAIRD